MPLLWKTLLSAYFENFGVRKKFLIFWENYTSRKYSSINGQYNFNHQLKSFDAIVFNQVPTDWVQNLADKNEAERVNLPLSAM